MLTLESRLYCTSGMEEWYLGLTFLLLVSNFLGSNEAEENISWLE